jgi:diphthamide synthase (EF-2-diphthine--ammonia ligase)
MTKKAIFSWSGGKDSALALYELQNTENYEILGLLTTVNEGFDRISIHGVRQILLEQQADSLGFPLEKVFISKKASLEEYESKMQKALNKCSPLGIPYVVFGDIFLEDVRKYREDQLSRV